MHAPLLVLFCATTNEPLQPRELNETAQRPSTASSLLAPPEVPRGRGRARRESSGSGMLGCFILALGYFILALRCFILSCLATMRSDNILLNTH